MIKEVFTTVALLSTIAFFIIIELNINLEKSADKNIYNRYVDIKSTDDSINLYSNLLK